MAATGQCRPASSRLAVHHPRCPDQAPPPLPKHKARISCDDLLGDQAGEYVESLASRVIRAQSWSRIASAGVSQEPPTQPTFGSARYDAAFASVMPPVGQNRAWGTGAPIAFRKPTPPETSAGKSFISE